MEILLSTACYCKENTDINKRVNRALTHGVAGVEISLSRVEEIIGIANNSMYAITQSEADFLADNYITTIRAPTIGVKYSNHNRSNQAMKWLQLLYTWLKAKNVTFHISSIEDFDYVRRRLKGCHVSVENPSPKDENHYSLDDVLDNYSFELTLDVCHALQNSKKELDKLAHHNKISEVYWNMPTKKRDAKSAIFRKKRNLEYDTFLEEEIIHTKGLVRKIDKPVSLEIGIPIHFGIEEGYGKKKSLSISSEIEFLKAEA